MKNFNVLICARGGSKGLKNKNIKNFLGKPLIAWTILLAKKIPNVNKIIVSTDSLKIAAISKKYGAEIPFIRPKKLALDKSPEWKTWKHAIEYFDSKKIKMKGLVVLPVTSPLRNLMDVKKSIKYYLQYKCTVMCITRSNLNPYFNMVKKKKFCSLLINKKKYHSRQSAPQVYNMTTICFVVNPETVKKGSYLFDRKVFGLEVPKERSVDIDDINDFNYAQFLKKNFND